MNDRRPSRTLRSRFRLRTLQRFALTLLALAMMAIASATPSRADDYDEKSAGHPLRIIAYVLHPVGVAIDYLLLRPAHWLGNREPLKTIFGHED
jgi:hypothetical protein